MHTIAYNRTAGSCFYTQCSPAPSCHCGGAPGLAAEYGSGSRHGTRGPPNYLRPTNAASDTLRIITRPDVHPYCPASLVATHLDLRVSSGPVYVHYLVLEPLEVPIPIKLGWLADASRPLPRSAERDPNATAHGYCQVVRPPCIRTVPTTWEPIGPTRR